MKKLELKKRISNLNAEVLLSTQLVKVKGGLLPSVDDCSSCSQSCSSSCSSRRSS